MLPRHLVPIIPFSIIQPQVIFQNANVVMRWHAQKPSRSPPPKDKVQGPTHGSWDLACLALTFSSRPCFSSSPVIPLSLLAQTLPCGSTERSHSHSYPSVIPHLWSLFSQLFTFTSWTFLKISAHESPIL